MKERGEQVRAYLVQKMREMGVARSGAIGHAYKFEQAVEQKRKGHARTRRIEEGRKGNEERYKWKIISVLGFLKKEKEKEDMEEVIRSIDRGRQRDRKKGTVKYL